MCDLVKKEVAVQPISRKNGSFKLKIGQIDKGNERSTQNNGTRKSFCYFCFAMKSFKESFSWRFWRCFVLKPITILALPFYVFNCIFFHTSILSDIGRNWYNSNIGLILGFRHLPQGFLVPNASVWGICWTFSSWNAHFLIHWKDCCFKTSQGAGSDKCVIPGLANANFFDYLFSF